MGGANFAGTCIDGVSSENIDLAFEPRSGNFKGHEEIGKLNNGANPNGNWLLTIEDNFWGDEANLTALSLTFSNDPASYFTMQHSKLPIMIINAASEIGDEPKVMADMKLIYNGPGAINHITDSPNAYNGKIGIETRGDFSASLPQKSYAVELWDNSMQEIEQELLGMPAEKDWVLIANYNDKSFSRNILAQRLFGEMGHYAVRCRLVDVVLNNHYEGIYLLMEKIKRDSNRVDVPKLNPTEISGVERTGGYIFKFEYSTESEIDHFYLPNNTTPMVYYYPQPEILATEQKNYLQQYLNDFETSLFSAQFADPVNGFRKFIKEESFIDYLLMSEFSMNGDGYLKSRYFSKKKDNIDGTYSPFKAGPVWDFDWSMKYYSDLPDAVQGFNYGYAGLGGDAWYLRMMEDPTFVNEVRCRYNVLRSSVLSDNHIDAVIDSVAAYVSESQQWHFDTWQNLGIVTGSPEIYASLTYAEEIQRLKTLLHARLDWMDDNLPGTPVNCNLGTDELSATQPLVYPNPFNDQLTIQWTEDFSDATIRLTDATGRIIQVWQKIQPTDGTVKLSLSSTGELSSGIFYLTIEKATIISTVKVLH